MEMYKIGHAHSITAAIHSEPQDHDALKRIQRGTEITAEVLLLLPRKRRDTRIGLVVDVGDEALLQLAPGLP